MEILNKLIFIYFILFVISSGYITGQNKINNKKSVTVPFVLDHNRMLIDAEVQKSDGSWRKVKLWIDTGNPYLFMSQSLARDLGKDLSAKDKSATEISSLVVSNPAGIRIGNMDLNLDGVTSRVVFQPFWIFNSLHNEANLPSSVLKKYNIIFDYPKKELTIAEPGVTNPRGIASTININNETGILQMDAMIGNDSLSFALDNGASYSFISNEKLSVLTASHPEWPNITGTVGCANMWGWWPANENLSPVVRIPEIHWGQTSLKGVGIVGVFKFSPQGPTFGEWYSKKTARPVDGILGPNALKTFRVEIDYTKSKIYFEKTSEVDKQEMDIVGLSVRQLPDSTYQIVGVAKKEERLLVEGVEPEDILISIDEFKVRGHTMGRVVDALRGKPGDIHVLLLDRNGKRIKIAARVKHCL
jgi:hypothetical protein